jgi:hypothetical protein
MLLADGTFGGHRIILKKTLKDVFGPSMVSPGGGPLKDGYSTTGLGCDSYHFLNHRRKERRFVRDEEPCHPCPDTAPEPHPDTLKYRKSYVLFERRAFAFHGARCQT